MSALFSVAVAFIFWQLLTIYLDHLKSSNHKKLKSDIESAIANGTPSWSQIKTISSTYPWLIDNSIKKNINKIISEKVISGTESNKDNIELLEEWLEMLTSDEPFEGIPSELKVPLERIRKDAPDQAHLLELLVSQLQEFNEKSQAEKKRKNYISILSLMFGIAGFLVGGYQLYSNEVPPKASVIQSKSE